MEMLALAVVAYSLQVLVVVIVAALAAFAMPLSLPSARLAYWRGVGLVCLALPILAAARPEIAAAPAAFVIDVASLRAASAADAPGLAALAPIFLAIYAAGAGVRLTGLLAGAVRLRRIRACSIPAMLGSEVESLRAEIAPRAELRWMDTIDQPVAFGVKRALVLLPRRFAALGDEAQRAVLCHELLHVRSGDWAWIVIEEHLRALFWFHPAALWVLEQIHLSREQAIDREVVARTGSRRAYMDALMAFADTPHAVVPSTAFLRSRHLKSRLQQLSKEPHMSRQRLIVTIAGLTLVTAGAAATASIAFPLHPSARSSAAARGPAQGRADLRMPVVVHRVQPRYTPEALRAKIEGEVMLEVVVEADGSVGNVVVKKSLDAVYGLDEQAVDAVKQWEFEPGTKDGTPVPVSVSIEMTFTLK